MTGISKPCGESWGDSFLSKRKQGKSDFLDITQFYIADKFCVARLGYLNIPVRMGDIFTAVLL